MLIWTNIPTLIHLAIIHLIFLDDPRRIQHGVVFWKRMVYLVQWFLNFLHIEYYFLFLGLSHRPPYKYVPVSWGCRIHRLYLCRGVRLLNVCPVAQSAGAVEYTDCNSEEEQDSSNKCSVAQSAGAVEYTGCICADDKDSPRCVLWPSRLGLYNTPTASLQRG